VAPRSAVGRDVAQGRAQEEGSAQPLGEPLGCALRLLGGSIEDLVDERRDVVHAGIRRLGDGLLARGQRGSAGDERHECVGGNRLACLHFVCLSCREVGCTGGQRLAPGLGRVKLLTGQSAPRDLGGSPHDPARA